MSAGNGRELSACQGARRRHYGAFMILASQALAPSRPLGTTDILVSPMCLGANVFGWSATVEESNEVLGAYAELGGNFIDTADLYAGGRSEPIIGEWMRSRGNRADMIIATKVGKRATHRGLAPANIRSAVEASLINLQTDYIDVYFAHADDLDVPIADTLTAFDELVRAGKVRCIAASNFTADRLREALAFSSDNGLASYVGVQDLYNLMDRHEYEDGVKPVVLEHGLASLPYFSLANGFLTGKYLPGVTIKSPRAVDAEKYIGERGDRVLTAVESVAKDHETSLASVALAWLLAQASVTAPLVSARNVQQLQGLVPMAGLHLTVDDLALLTAASD